MSIPTHFHFIFHSMLFISVFSSKTTENTEWFEKQKKGCESLTHNLYLAEREGFEPPVPLSTTVFKTAAIDHSAISPKLLYKKHFFSKAMQRYGFFLNPQAFQRFF